MRSSYRTFLLWLFLVGLFLTFYSPRWPGSSWRIVKHSEATSSAFQAHLREAVVPGEFDYLAADWPELGAFIRSLGKARAAGAVA
jgi:hypothetical protein